MEGELGWNETGIVWYYGYDVFYTLIKSQEKVFTGGKMEGELGRNETGIVWYYGYDVLYTLIKSQEKVFTGGEMEGELGLNETGIVWYYDYDVLYTLIKSQEKVFTGRKMEGELGQNETGIVWYYDYDVLYTLKTNCIWCQGHQEEWPLCRLHASHYYCIVRETAPFKTLKESLVCILGNPSPLSDRIYFLHTLYTLLSKWVSFLGNWSCFSLSKAKFDWVMLPYIVISCLV